MEITGGEPDVVGQDKKTVNMFFMIAQQKVLKTEEVFVTITKRWKKEKNINQQIVAINMATDMGIELLTEEEYGSYSNSGNFDTKTSQLDENAC
jgi:hypothetical protein